MWTNQVAVLFANIFGITSGLLRGGAPVDSLTSRPNEEDLRAVRNVESVSADAMAQSFSLFRERHSRTYEAGSEEYQMRYELFKHRAAEVQRLNKRPYKLWTAAVNHFSDRTNEELAAMRGWSPSIRRGAGDEDDDEISEDFFETDDLPETSDWLSLANMDHIRDQGGCGSCWAVSAATVLSSHSEIYAQNMTFSTQQIVDCVPNPNSCGGTGGCQGATVELAFQYIMHVGGHTPEEYGGYTATDGVCAQTFSEASTPSMATLTEIGTNAKLWKAPKHAPGMAHGMYGWMKLPSNKAKPLMYSVHNYGPVAVALAASDVMLYSGGIFNECKDVTVNHAVTLVGYGVDNGNKYWLIQNSWGSFWGEEGRIRLLRTDDEDGNCDTDYDPQAGIACEGETDPVWVCGTCGVLYDSVVPRFDKFDGVLS